MYGKATSCGNDMLVNRSSSCIASCCRLRNSAMGPGHCSLFIIMHIFYILHSYRNKGTAYPKVASARSALWQVIVPTMQCPTLSVKWRDVRLLNCAEETSSVGLFCRRRHRMKWGSEGPIAVAWRLRQEGGTLAHVLIAVHGPRKVSTMSIEVKIDRIACDTGVWTGRAALRAGPAGPHARVGHPGRSTV